MGWRPSKKEMTDDAKRRPVERVRIVSVRQSMIQLGKLDVEGLRNCRGRHPWRLVYRD